MIEALPTTAYGPILQDKRVVRALELIWYEADLLDRKDYKTWKGLYTEDGHYIVPIDRESDDFEDMLNMVYDDARMRDLRVQRMTEGYAIAAVDSATTIRTISRPIPVEVSEEHVTLRTAQILVAYKRGDHDIWASENTYTVCLSTVDDRILRKVVRLIDSEEAVPAAGFLL